MEYPEKDKDPLDAAAVQLEKIARQLRVTNKLKVIELKLARAVMPPSTRSLDRLIAEAENTMLEEP